MKSTNLKLMPTNIEETIVYKDNCYALFLITHLTVPFTFISSEPISIRAYRKTSLLYRIKCKLVFNNDKATFVSVQEIIHFCSFISLFQLKHTCHNKRISSYLCINVCPNPQEIALLYNLIVPIIICFQCYFCIS